MVRMIYCLYKFFKELSPTITLRTGQGGNAAAITSEIVWAIT